MMIVFSILERIHDRAIDYLQAMAGLVGMNAGNGGCLQNVSSLPAHEPISHRHRSAKRRNCNQRERVASRHLVSPQLVTADGNAVPAESQPVSLKRFVALGICCLLVLAVAVVFGQAVHHEFVNYDDDQYVYGNPKIAEGLSLRGVAWAFTCSHAGNWHPLTWISHMMDCSLYGLRPAGHHVTSVVLHATSAVLLFLVLAWMTGRLGPSAMAAALFTVHPLRAESVAWVAERKDVLSGLFFMLTLIAYTWYVRRPFSLARYLAVVLSLALGLMAKPMLVTVPFVLLLLDYWPLGRFSSTGALDGTFSPAPTVSNHPTLTRLLVEKVPLFALTVVSCVVTVTSQGMGIRSIEQVTLLSRIANALVSYVTYLWLAVWPTQLAPLYPYPATLPSPWKVLGALCLLIGISTVAVVWRRKHPCLLVGWLWYLGMLVPVIGLVTVGFQAIADRYTYLPLIGPCLAVAYVLADHTPSRPSLRWVLNAGAAMILACLMHGAWVQTSYWRNSSTLWTHTLSCTSQNFVAHCNLGGDLARRGYLDLAADQYRKALQVKPDYARVCNNLGTVLADLGRIDEAMEHYRRALEITPVFAEVYYNMGNVCARRNKFDEAIHYFQKAVQLAPQVAAFHNNLGAALADRGRADEAMDHYRKAMKLKTNYADPHFNLGSAFVRRGQLDKALAEWREAVRIEPKYAKAHLALGKLYYRQRKLVDAVRHLRIALKLKPHSAEVRQCLNSILGRDRATGEAGIRNDMQSLLRNNDRGRQGVVQHHGSTQSKDAIGAHSSRGVPPNSATNSIQQEDRSSTPL